MKLKKSWKRYYNLGMVCRGRTLWGMSVQGLIRYGEDIIFIVLGQSRFVKVVFVPVWYG